MMFKATFSANLLLHWIISRWTHTAEQILPVQLSSVLYFLSFMDNAI